MIQNEAEEGESQQICKNYVIFQKFNDFYYILTTIVIFIINGFFYSIIEPLVASIGYPLRTDENWLVAFAVFICLCIDMMFLPVLIGMNLMEHTDNTFSNMVFKGRYTDINSKWYDDVGYQIEVLLMLFLL